MRSVLLVLLMVVAGAARGRHVETTFVVDDSEAYNAWPTIHALGGKLFVLYTHARGHEFDNGKGETGRASMSADGGRTWSAPIPASCAQPAKDFWGPCGTATLREGDAFVWWRHWKGPELYHTLVRTADGEHFEPVAKPKLDPMPVQIMKPIHVPGRGWVSIWFAGSYQKQEGHSWGLIWSADGGRTWTQQVVERDLLKADWPTEPSLLHLGGTRMMAVARCEQRCAGNPVRREFVLTSEDLGRTWRRRLTNIGDVLESTPSAFYEPATDELTLYYFHRGPGLLKRRTARAKEIFDDATRWSEPEVVACGRKLRDWDSGNVNAIRLNGSDYLAYYAGDAKVSSVLVSVVGAGETPAESLEGRRVLLLGNRTREDARAFSRRHRCEAYAYPTREEAYRHHPPEAFARILDVEGQVWDFTQGVPQDGTLRAGAVWRKGLVATNAGNVALASGFEVKRHVLPEAFRFEAEFTIPAEMPEGSRGGVLWDDMYVNYLPKRRDQGLQVAFLRRGEDWTPVVYAGLSNTTCRVTGPTKKLAPGTTAQLVFVYDANRRIAWNFCGEERESYLTRAGGIAPSRYRAIVGDRYGSNYDAFGATIRRVSITPVARPPLALAVEGRLAFERGEDGAKVRFVLENFAAAPCAGARLEVRQLTAEGRCVKTFAQALGTIPQGGQSPCDVPVETRVRTGTATLEATLVHDGGRLTRAVAIAVGPRHAPRMPALMWGFAAPAATLAEFGFTHGLDYGLGFNARRTESSDPQPTLRKLDAALACGVRLAKSTGVVYPEVAETNRVRFYRRTRDGRTSWRPKDRPAPEVSQPELVAEARRVAADNVQAFGAHPAFAGVLPCSELRDHTFPSFNTEPARYRAETGRAVPDEVHGTTWNLQKALAKFPDGVVPGDDPILAYYRWFWSGGDGWPGYVGAVAETYRKGVGRKDFLDFWDPSVRCPPRWGSGGTATYLNQWIYAVPEPMNVAGPLEEMFAMAAGRKGQQVTMMTQLICYRAQIAPSNVVVTPVPAWVAKRPRAGFPSIPPDSLQEATWSMLAKPVKGIMYHGWGTIYETGSETGYCFTNPQTTARLKELLHGVVARLGPTLLKLGRDDSPVAVLESATTCFMGGPASWGWTAPAITFLQRARLDPRVVYEETILRDGLGGVKVLYAPQCRFLTPDVIAKIRAFQAAGGVLVGDEQTLAALTPDVRAPLVSFRPPPASDHTEDVEAQEAAKSGDGKRRAGTVLAKATMLRQAEELRAALAAKYRPVTDSSSGELVVYSRRWKETDYVFALNDRRTFGDYVGPWGMTMEKGLPFRGTVTRADPARAVRAVYELSRGGEVAFAREADGTVKVPLAYETNDGRVLLFARQKIASVDVRVPKTVVKGAAFEVEMRVLDAAGRVVDALLPVEVRVYDAAGRELDGAGFACAEGGVCRLCVRTNLDDAKGAYRVTGRDLASGRVKTVTIE